jgi:signal peptidase I
MTPASAPLARSQPFLPQPLLLLLAATASVLVPVLYALALRAFVVEAFSIPSGAMMPTVMPGDHIFVRKLLLQPRRGDVAVFRFPLDTEVKYIKRIVAIAGDTVEQRRGQLLINGVAVNTVESDEPCDAPAESDCRIRIEELGHPYKVMLDGPPQDTAPVQVPPGHFFVMGDNRNNSNDSRVWGFVPDHLYIGRASLIWFSSGPEGPRWDRLFTAVR